MIKTVWEIHDFPENMIEWFSMIRLKGLHSLFYKLGKDEALSIDSPICLLCDVASQSNRVCSYFTGQVGRCSAKIGQP
ncbi:hypothetical protein JQC72_12935 [Polycladomyces sp. WAk]|uniref:Uncharacterized protein n=1 Tax=Polycladomyces zharkentensis TaxID=2807616 RepID=A0ABS2WLK8_9BACL|nr:hypothetical protein [Polycladomyces sp. WAk]MBN2910404.1 hypothetical protein [Polycladomyces sp. WAk]